MSQCQTVCCLWQPEPERKNYTVSLKGVFSNDIHDSECVLMIFMAVMFPNDIPLSSGSVEPVQNGHSETR